MKVPKHPAFVEALALLKSEGWSDLKIAHAFGLSSKTVAVHRGAWGIARSDSQYKQKIDRDEALRMWGAGESDGQIARRFGVTQSGATRWRHREGLAPNFEAHSPLAREVKRRAHDMVLRGASRGQISEELAVSKSFLTKIRRSMSSPGMRRTGLTNNSIRSQILKDKHLLPQIEAAVGRDIPPDVRQDTVGDIYLEVLSGRLARELIKQEVPRFRSRAFQVNYGRYGDVSIDADRGGWTLGDLIEDKDALNFVEEIANDG